MKDKRQAHLSEWSKETWHLTNILKAEMYLLEVYQEIVTKTGTLQDFKENKFIKFDINQN